MKNTGHVRIDIDMHEVMVRVDPDRALDDACARWNAPEPDERDRAGIMSAMEKQVKARFLYDYGARLDILTGDIDFQTTREDAESGGPWSLPGSGRGRLTYSADGMDLDDVRSYCEDACVEYMRTALSYSAAGLEQYDRQS